MNIRTNIKVLSITETIFVPVPFSFQRVEFCHFLQKVSSAISSIACREQPVHFLQCVFGDWQGGSAINSMTINQAMAV